MVTIRSARFDDAAAIAAIYDQRIAERGATFETTPRTFDDILQRLAEDDRFPLLIAVEADGAIIGWAGLSAYRPRDCYAGIRTGGRSTYAGAPLADPALVRHRCGRPLEW